MIDRKKACFVLGLFTCLFFAGCGFFGAGNNTNGTISFHNAVGWAVGNPSDGYGVILHTTNGGDTWGRQGVTLEVPAVTLSSVSAIDNEHVWIVGGSSNGYPTVLKTADGGVTWVRKSSATYLGTDDLLKISALDNQTAWAVGINGAILKTIDGGDTWARQGSSEVPAVQLQAVYALNASTVWVGGFPSDGYPTILKTTDGGDHWVRQAAVSREAGARFVIDIYAVDENNVWAVGQGTLMPPLVLKTADGGNSWASQEVHHLGDANGIFAFDKNTAWIAQDGNGISMTVDGGNNWGTQEAAVLESYFFLCPRALNKDVCWIVGEALRYPVDGVIMRTIDAGTHWASCEAMPANNGLWGLTFVGIR